MAAMGSVTGDTSDNQKMSEVEFNDRSYCKMLLHCGKYPHVAVNGILLAKASAGKLLFVDTIPLFHISLNTTPMYEIALPQIEKSGKDGLVIAGYYFAAENLKELPTEAANRVASKIAEYFPNACLVLIDNQKFPSIHDGHRGLPLQISQASEGKGFKRVTSVEVSEETVEKANGLLQKYRRDIVDFDNHLDDLRQDWRNPKINQLIENWEPEPLSGF